MSKITNVIIVVVILVIIILAAVGIYVYVGRNYNKPIPGPEIQF